MISSSFLVGKKRHQQEIKIGCTALRSSTSHTLCFGKGSKNNTLRWMAKEKTEDISDASRRLPYTMHILVVHRISSVFFSVCDLFFVSDLFPRLAARFLFSGSNLSSVLVTLHTHIRKLTIKKVNRTEISK